MDSTQEVVVGGCWGYVYYFSHTYTDAWWKGQQVEFKNVVSSSKNG